MDTDVPNGTEQSKKTRKVKKQVRKGDLPISSGTASLDQANKEAWSEKENSMAMEDKLVADTDEKKNELESSIYELRDKIDTTYSEFASEQEKETLRAKLTETEVRILTETQFHFRLLDYNTDGEIGLAVRRRRRYHQSYLCRQNGGDPLCCWSYHSTLHG